MSDALILIVDDIPENIDILSGLLSDYRKKVATNGKKAIQLALGIDPPDLILLDIDIPEMNGFEVCDTLKRDPATSDIPIIFLTARTDKKVMVEGFQLGANDFMTKPFNADELIVRIKTQLSLRETTRRLESTIRLLTTSSEEMAKQKKAIEEGEKKADSLLLNILPEYAAKELKEKGFIVPRRFPVATVLFADLVGFSKLCQGLTPEQIVGELNYLFVGFDFILERYNLEKIKTIGDGYMAAGGIPHPNSTSPVDAVKAGLEMIRSVERIRKDNEKSGKPSWGIRIGIHTGDLVAGVIGKSKFAYDIWGSAVNIASRMESAGEPGKVNVSGVTHQLVKEIFNTEYRGGIDVKNMGKMDMYFCTSKTS